jgi:threonine/homoserine/homoserine lactone efflux protein
MDWPSLLAFTVALAIAAAIPGPGIAALVGRALASGFWASLPMITGLIVGDLFYLTAAVAGLGVLAETMGEVFLLIRIAGAAYLAWLAWRLWTARGEADGFAAASGAAPPLRTFLAGLSVTLGNPKVMLFYLALLPSIIDIGSVTPAGYAEIAAITIAVLALVLGAYAAAVGAARRLVVRERQRRLLNRSAATAMMGAAAAMLVK